MKVFPLRKHFLIFLFFLADIQAETINWYNTPQKVNITSIGAQMDGSFQFQLGVFTTGFVPTVGNMNQWAAHWGVADTDAYNETTKSYNRSFVVTGNPPPFNVGAAAYVWGRATSATKDEWILFRKSDWNWPAPNPMNPFDLPWNAAMADQVILGSINSSGTPFLMKSAAVSTYSQWRTAELNYEPQNAATQDPDRDGIPNLMEFIFGTPPLFPNAAAAMPLTLVDVSGQSYLQITIPRRTDRLAILELEVSANLSQWNSGTTHTVVVENSTAALIVRDLTPFQPGNSKRFMRLKATLP